MFCEDIHIEILSATENGNIDKIIKLLSSFRVDLNFISERYISPLIQAAIQGHDHVLQLLLDNGAEPNLAI